MSDKDDITQSLEDYLECIYTEQLKKRVVRLKDIVKLMKVQMPSVNSAIKALKKKGYVVQEPYGHIDITPLGVETAKQILDKHTVLSKILIKIGVSEEQAEADACEIEHHISEETFSKLKSFFGVTSNI